MDDEHLHDTIHSAVRDALADQNAELRDTIHSAVREALADQDYELRDTIHGGVRDALAERNKPLHDTIHSAVGDALEQKGNLVVKGVYLLVIFWIGFAVLDDLSYARWMNKARYSVWYSVDTSDVRQPQDKPPSDCDFLKAPIGQKGCHYKKNIEVQEPSAKNANKRSVYVYWSREADDGS